jgi:uncharacterized protein (TIGR00730 family)
MCLGVFSTRNVFQSRSGMLMTEQDGWPPKAYKNLDFLNSTEARTLRILAEYLEPQDRFQKMGVKDTIVFFGSARISPRKIARQRLKDLQSKMGEAKRKTSRMIQDLALAESGLRLSKYYEDATELARLLTHWSLGLPGGRRFVISSGGGPGIMEAANRGASKAGGPSIGLNISLPFEQHYNPFITKELNFEFHYFFMRKLWFVYLAKAAVIFPGGFGTLDELMEVLTLLQTGKVGKKIPMVIYGSEFWKEVINFDALTKWGVISPQDLDLFQFVDSPEEAFETLKSQLTQLYLS